MDETTDRQIVNYKVASLPKIFEIEQDESDENTDDVSSQAEYMNPYMGPRERFVRPNVNRSMKDIVQSLSKTTEEDKQNKVLFVCVCSHNFLEFRPR